MDRRVATGGLFGLRIRLMRRIGIALLEVALVASCGGGSDRGEGGVRRVNEIDDFCPGRPHCVDPGDGKLYVGAAKALINPSWDLYETEFTDENGDKCWQRAEPFVDRNGNGKLDGLWLGGFCQPRPATSQLGDLWVRTIALRQGDTLVVVSYSDTFGLFLDFEDSIRTRPAVAGLGIDHLIIGASHSHAAHDTLGIYGPTVVDPGSDPAYMEMLRLATERSIVDAVAALEPAYMIVAAPKAVNENGECRDYVSDKRDPLILDPHITVLRFVKESDPQVTIGTLLSFGAHPEYIFADSNLLSADYVGFLRDHVESGFPSEGIDGIGGVTVHVQGALGGQIGPIGAAPRDDSGTPITEYGPAKAEAAGKQLARKALLGLEEAGELVQAPALSYRTAKIWARVDNTAFHALFLAGTIKRDCLEYDEDLPIDPATNWPWLCTRISYLRIGPVGIVTAPGELNPELWVGGYDGSWSWGMDIIEDPDKPFPPDLSAAPPPPYLRDLVVEQGVKYPVLAGLAHDQLGYFVARFNFVLNEETPYLDQAGGDHYEETNSLGPDVESHIVGPMMRLVTWKPGDETVFPVEKTEVPE